MPTPYLGLPYIAQGQAQKEIAHNEALNLLDAVVQLAVKGRTTVNPPVAPAEGERWIIPPGATGAWAGQTNKVALWKDGFWRFFTPQDGWLAFVQDVARSSTPLAAGNLSSSSRSTGPVSAWILLKRRSFAPVPR